MKELLRLGIEPRAEIGLSPATLFKRRVHMDKENFLLEEYDEDAEKYYSLVTIMAFLSVFFSSVAMVFIVTLLTICS